VARWTLFVSCAVVLAALAVGLGLTTTNADKKAPVTSAANASALTPATVAADLQIAFRRVYDRVSPSVVQIETTDGLGSGIVFDSRGDIVTNDHVVGNSKTFTVTTSAGAGRQLKGTLVGTFAPDDLAVIKVAGVKLEPATFADSSQLHVGDITMAIGNPLGLKSSFTQGIVSALDRSQPEGNGVTLATAIQTSAPINPGNSGGALVDIRGRVVGIPTLAALSPQVGGAAEGIGFAIPSDVVVDIARQLIARGKVTDSHRAYLGVQVADTIDSVGAYVTKVLPGTPAATAGLRPSDLIASVDGQPTPGAAALGSVLASLKPGQTVAVEIKRNGKTHTLQLKLAKFPGGG
jgi:putative serine protease PepD